MGKSRQSNDRKKIRNSGIRKRNPLVFMAAEGDNKTEKYYFDAFFKDRSIRVVNDSSGYTNPVQLVESLHKKMGQKGFDKELGDKAFCLIDADCDSLKNQIINKADKKAKKYGIQLIVSAPCFEVWFICHFTFSTTKYTSNKDVMNKLQSYCEGYQKSDENMYLKLKGNTGIAIANAKKLEKECTSLKRIPHTVDFSPSTEVYKIVEMYEI